MKSLRNKIPAIFAILFGLSFLAFMPAEKVTVKGIRMLPFRLPVAAQG
jgi:hypothetical protein